LGTATTGMFVSLAMLYMVGAQVTLLICDAHSAVGSQVLIDKATQILELDGGTAHVDSVGRTWAPQEIAQLQHAVRLVAGVPWVFFLLAQLAACAFLFYASGLAVRMRPALERLLSCSAHPSTKSAVSGQGFLRRYRFVLASYIIAVGGLILYGIVVAGHSSAAAVIHVGEESGDQPGSPASIMLATLALGYPRHVGTVDIVLRAVVTLYFIVLAVLLLLSLGELFYARAAKAKNIRTREQGATPEDVLRLQSMCNSLCEETLAFRPSVIITESRFPYARAHMCGLFTRRYHVEVSSRCLALLSADELRSIMAHEVGHIASKHCVIDLLLCICGRVAFVGDAVMRGVEDVYAFELTADAYAIRQLGVSHTAMKTALWKIRNITAMETAIARFSMNDDGVSFAAMPLQSSPNRGGRRILAGFAARWKALYMQYTGRDRVGFWHPELAERVAALEAAEALSIDGKRCCS